MADPSFASFVLLLSFRPDTSRAVCCVLSLSRPGEQKSKKSKHRTAAGGGAASADGAAAGAAAGGGKTAKGKSSGSKTGGKNTVGGKKAAATTTKKEGNGSSRCVCLRKTVVCVATGLVWCAVLCWPRGFLPRA